MTVASKIAEYALETTYKSIPENIKELAHRSLLDYVGVTFAGSRTKEAEVLMEYIKTHPQNDESRILGRSGCWCMEDAALVNGYFSHILDYDDAGMIGHPSAVLMSTCFAVGEPEMITGEEFLTAYIVGYQVSLKLADPLMPELTGRGWHGTPVFGCIGSAVAAGRIMKLSKKQMINAIGIAATMASGLMENFGTTTKPFHAGMAAANGIKAAKLAKAGLGASPNAIDGECGYGKLFADILLVESDVVLEDWTLYEQDLLLKKYPCCSAAHAALNCIEEIRDAENLTVDDIERIDVGVTKFTLINLIHPNPRTAIEARFSMQYAIAATLVTGKFGVESFKGEILKNKEIRELSAHINMFEAEEFVDNPYADNEPAVVRVYLKDGRIKERRVDYAKGSTVNPISDKEIEEKFYECVGERSERYNRMYDYLKAIESVSDMKFFMGMIL